MTTNQGGDPGDGSGDNNNLWSTILKQVQQGSTMKLPSSKAVIVLGENETGKTSLVAKMQSNEDPRKGSGLEYHHILVRDEYRDEHTKLGFWLLDGDQFYQHLLKFALNPDSVIDTTIIITASMTQPWDLITSLEKWATILDQHLNRILSPERRRTMKAATIKRFTEYISPGDEVEGLVSSPVKTRSESDPTMEPEPITLEGDALSCNLGMDIVVVITKTDYMSVLEKQFSYKEEAFDFIQQAIRKFCLRYGASLLYVSAKMNKNCDLLNKYLVHRIYGLPFKTPALVVEKDALFIPSGWDNEKKISILYENIQTVNPDDPFSEVIVEPGEMHANGADAEVSAEDDQDFLHKMQTQLNQTIPSSSSSSQGTPQNPSFRPPGQKGSVGRNSLGNQVDPSKGSPGGEGVLQNFFNSLLNRKSGAGIPSPGVSSSNAGSPRNSSMDGLPTTPLLIGASKTMNRVDVAAELDRLASGSSSLSTTPKHNKMDTLGDSNEIDNESESSHLPN